jgi:hypothetical protein
VDRTQSSRRPGIIQKVTESVTLAALPSVATSVAVKEPCGVKYVRPEPVPASPAVTDANESCHDPIGVCELPMQSVELWAMYETDGGCGVHGEQPKPEQTAPQPGGQSGPVPPSQLTPAGTGK